MLKNTFRRLVGILILVVFGIAIFQFSRQTAGNAYLWDALSAGFWLVVFLFAIVGLAGWVDRRKRRHGE